jgi:hypothetical protein
MGAHHPPTYPTDAVFLEPTDALNVTDLRQFVCAQCHHVKVGMDQHPCDHCGGTVFSQHADPDGIYQEAQELVSKRDRVSIMPFINPATGNPEIDFPDECESAEDFYSLAQSRVNRRLRERLVVRLEEEIERDLREGGPTPLPTNEQAAMAMIRSMAGHLEEAAEALDQLAAHLKSDGGKGFRASQAKQAAMKARKAARELIGQ